MIATANPVRMRGGQQIAEALVDALSELEIEQPIVLNGVAWETYERLLVERDRTRPGVRLVFDRGRLEIMSVSLTHERWKKALARLIETLALALDIPLVASGNLTIRNEDLARGLEPDESYYVQNAAAMLGIGELDLTRDPPFDLAVEIEYSRSIINRLPILDALKVREVWRYDGEQMRVLIRRPEGGYAEASASEAFPQVPLGIWNEFLKRVGTVDDTKLAREFYDWATQNLEKSPGEQKS